MSEYTFKQFAEKMFRGFYVYHLKENPINEPYKKEN